MTTTRTLIQRLTPDGVVTDLDRPTSTPVTLGAPGIVPPTKKAPAPKPRVVDIELLSPPLVVETIPPRIIGGVKK